MAKIQDTISQVMAQEVSRTDFLKMTGVAFLGIIGVQHLMSSLGNGFHATNRTGRGYGGNVYGR